MSTNAASMYHKTFTSMPKKRTRTVFPAWSADVSADEYELLQRVDAGMKNIAETGGTDYDEFRKELGLT